MENTTSIQIEKDTLDRLKKFGVIGDTYDSLLNKWMDEKENKGGV